MARCIHTEVNPNADAQSGAAPPCDQDLTMMLPATDDLERGRRVWRALPKLSLDSEEAPPYRKCVY